MLENPKSDLIWDTLNSEQRLYFKIIHLFLKVKFGTNHFNETNYQIDVFDRKSRKYYDFCYFLFFLLTQTTENPR